MKNNRVVELINNEIRRRQSVGVNTEEWCVRPHKFAESGRRRYLGASQLGGKCRRQRWYEFHWAVPQVKWDPRMLRLFDRGHREEERMIGYLRLIGVEAQEYDPDTIPSLWYYPESDRYAIALPWQVPHVISEGGWIDVSNTYHEWIARSRGVEIPEPRQFSYIDFNGHHAGHSDGRARNIPDYDKWGLSAEEWVLLEFKTHNERSFNELVASSVVESKYGHYAQAQRYMHKLHQRLCVYMAVNKNTDELYCEYIPINSDFDIILNHNASEAIYANSPPPRISGSPSWWECRFCDARPQCHFGVPHDRNCRSCNQSQPVDNGRWHCNRWGKLIPIDFESVGCDAWHERSD